MNADDINRGRYLCHHGVKGMHWGEWNEETRRRRIGRMSGQKFRAEAALDARIKDLGRVVNREISTGVDFIFRTNKNIHGDELKDKFGDELGSYDDAISEFKSELSELKMEPEDISEAYKYVNPMSGAPGYGDNCMGCSIASVFRAKGYDVEADSSFTDDFNDENENIESKTMAKTSYLSKIFGKNPESPLSNFKKAVDEGGDEDELADRFAGCFDDIVHVLGEDATVPTRYPKLDAGSLAYDIKFHPEKYPEGSYGVVFGGYTGEDSGHIFNYKIENGQMVGYDGQPHVDGKKGETDSVYRLIQNFTDGSIGTMRLDDVDLDTIDYEKLYEWSGLRPARPRY